MVKINWRIQILTAILCIFIFVPAEKLLNDAQHIQACYLFVFTLLADPIFRILTVIFMAVWFVFFWITAWRKGDVYLLCFLVFGARGCFSDQVFWFSRCFLILITGMLLAKASIRGLSNSPFVFCEDRPQSFPHCVRVVRWPLTVITIILGGTVFWRPDSVNATYHGTRWTGLWSNPNLYGALMATGLVVAVGLSYAVYKGGWLWAWLCIFLMSLFTWGLIMSGSRGALLGAVIGMSYFLWMRGSVSFRHIVLASTLMCLAVAFFWHNTSESNPGFVQRADFSRGSVQHRLSAWKNCLLLMTRFPLGVGWDHARQFYEKSISSEANTAEALFTNDFMRIGLELGPTAMVCLLAYFLTRWIGVVEKLRSTSVDIKKFSATQQSSLRSGDPFNMHDDDCEVILSCMSGCIVMMVCFWFDGGMFKLSASVFFWLLWEVGSRTLESKNLLLMKQEQDKGHQRRDVRRII